MITIPAKISPIPLYDLSANEDPSIFVVSNSVVSSVASRAAGSGADGGMDCFRAWIPVPGDAAFSI
jgi:hypothetical protein